MFELHSFFFFLSDCLKLLTTYRSLLHDSIVMVAYNLHYANAHENLNNVSIATIVEECSSGNRKLVRWTKDLLGNVHKKQFYID